jgi:hypothetical protein
MSHLNYSTTTQIDHLWNEMANRKQNLTKFQLINRKIKTDNNKKLPYFILFMKSDDSWPYFIDIIFSW